MVRGTSYLTAADIRELEQVSLNMHQTARDRANPKELVQIRRAASDGTFADLGLPVEVVIRRDRTVPGQPARESGAASVVTGKVRNYAPWDVQVGDRMEFVATGDVAVIDVPAPYIRDGIVRASWRIDQGRV